MEQKYRNWHISKGKIAKVVPVYKGKNLDPTQFTNYRPVALLSIIGKILEQVMYNQLMQFLSESAVLYPSQYGFRKNHSTVHAMFDFADFIGNGVDQGEVACGVFCDLSKAFDTLNHDTVQAKLDHYGVRGPALS